MKKNLQKINKKVDKFLDTIILRGFILLIDRMKSSIETSSYEHYLADIKNDLDILMHDIQQWPVKQEVHFPKDFLLRKDPLKTKASLYLLKHTSLSEERYKELFSSGENLKQGWLGNCYLVSALQSLVRSWYFPILIKTSFSKENSDRYRVTLPLGEPFWVRIPVDKKERNLASINGNTGYKILEIAFMKYMLQDPTLKITRALLHKFHQWNAWIVMKNLIGRRNIHAYFHKAWPWKDLTSLKAETQEKIINFLTSFEENQWKVFCSVNSLQWLSNRSSYRVGKEILYHNHAYTVLKVIKNKNWKIYRIKILNPRNTYTQPWGKYLYLELSEFLHAFRSITFWKLTPQFLNDETHSQDLQCIDNMFRFKPLKRKG